MVNDTIKRFCLGVYGKFVKIRIRRTRNVFGMIYYLRVGFKKS